MKSKVRFWQVGLAALVTWLAADATLKIVNAAQEPGSKVKAVVIKAAPAAEPKPVLPLRVKVLVWREYGITSRATFRLTNPNSFLITNPIVKCIYYGASDTPISAAATPIYVNVPAGKSIVTDEIVLGFMPQQGKTMRCDIA
jgi:hypothetical protein